MRLSSEWWKTHDQKSRPFMTWPSGVQCQKVSYRITLLGVSRDLPTSQTTSITISVSDVTTMQNSFGTTLQWFQWCLFNATCKQFIWFVALDPQGGDSISHHEKIQCCSGWGWVQIATLSRLLYACSHCWSVFSSSRMLNRTLKGFLLWFRSVQQGRLVRLLVCWLLRKDINLQCNSCTMEATVLSLRSASQSCISSRKARSKGLYTLFHWWRSRIARSCTWATQLTSMRSICFECRLFDSMLEIIVAAIYWNVMSVYSGCLNFCNGSCASLHIINVSRDYIVKNILEINGTVQKTVETIKI